MKTIAFDVMGSDLGVKPAIGAAIKILTEKKDLKIILVGNQDEIQNELDCNGKAKKVADRYEIFPTTETIKMTDGILEIRRKKNSSMVKALEIVRDDKANGMVTGGSTASFIAGSHFILKEFEGVSRPGFMPTIPTVIKDKIVLLLDVGANIENDPNDLLNFAIMATAYSKSTQGISNPLVGLLNIGEEKSKGKDLQIQTYKLLEESPKINFYGNIEPREIISGDVDIIVTDGFTGNIALKSIEGMGKKLLSEIKKSVTKGFFRKLAALSLKPAFKEVAAKFDYKNHAGAILLGVQKIAFKSHGSSDLRSFHATLRMTYDAISNEIDKKLEILLKESEGV
ncbi:glycerol-3-phosphate acyltransferase PlsX [Spiroplasma sabaudiense Ar-1343]|uniref:Phosphate acyltransferase n=1 Tax=Spiroplasma sabaudiense Ar-1343 TaxID=1276257 RepID=W6AB16_9MOLU|nr:phosphate acyltransferase PlsX [Spiroplasma sabaudiense]AHI54055.1 glycerol-3-phosphate acyltransferase PlsX [Spiroplasma sabaudiense Ar-1343]